MPKFDDGPAEIVKCSFCGKSQKQVKKLIAGPGVYICAECVELCVDILNMESTDADGRPKRPRRFPPVTGSGLF